MDKKIKEIMKVTHATSCTPKKCKCGMEEIEYELLILFSQQKKSYAREVIEAFYKDFVKEVDAEGYGWDRGEDFVKETLAKEAKNR